MLDATKKIVGCTVLGSAISIKEGVKDFGKNLAKGDVVSAAENAVGVAVVTMAVVPATAAATVFSLTLDIADAVNEMKK